MRARSQPWPTRRSSAACWNNGPALTRWIDNEPQSSNLYNRYGRDVGLAGADSPVGRLRLTRHGQIFNAYYTDRANEGWILSGSVPVPALADAVFLRLGAKHWPKGGRVPPTNHFRFTGFELRQWDRTAAGRDARRKGE